LSELVLGTAQWGTPYGVTNAAGRVSDDEVAAIIETARASGIRAVDSGAMYGNAQRRLRPWSNVFSITTKIDSSNHESLLPEVAKCLNELDRTALDTILIHDWERLDATNQTKVASQLRLIQGEGFAESFGVSVYGDTGVSSATEAFDSAGIPLAVIQVNANALDRRLDDSGPLKKCVTAGCRIQVRSVLLQGLLAGPSDAKLASHPNVRAFHQYAANVGLSPVAAALAHIRSLPWADQIVVGVTTADELREVVEAWNSCEPMQAPARLASKDLELIDPRRW